MQMRAEGVAFRVGVAVGSELRGEQLLHDFDAVVLTMGARAPRDLPIPGRELRGVHFAMEYLVQQNRRGAGDAVDAASRPILATGKHVVVIGGGDTGSDCVGTSIRQGAVSVTQLELMPKPASSASRATPGRSGRSSFARRARRKRAPSATGRSRRAASAARSGGSSRSIPFASCSRAARSKPLAGSEFSIPVRARPARDGLRGAGARRRRRAARARRSTREATCARTRAARRACRASSRRATSRAGSRSSCGPSPTVAASPPASTPGCASRWPGPA